MNHGSLFSGIGGFDLASEWMGWNNKFHCEWNEFGQKILNYYWPNAESYGDITQTDFTIWNGRIDILTGGFPCQPYSQAGKRRGKEDERHLWPEMLRAIKEIKPRWIVGENVYGIVNWNGGLVFDEVQVELENEGYNVQPYVLPAASVNAPHERYRVWFVAYSHNAGTDKQMQINGNRKKINQRQKKQPQPEFRQNGIYGDVANTKTKRLEGENRGEQKRSKPSRQIGFERFPTQPPIFFGNDGISSELDEITVPKWRNESIKAYGNAIVPQVALQIFKAIEQYEI